MAKISEQGTYRAVGSVVELSLVPDVQNIFESFAALAKVRLIVYSTEYELLGASLSGPSSRLNTVLRKELGLEEVYRRLHMEKQQEALLAKKPLLYRCPAGLTEVTMPVLLHGREVGSAVMSQFKTIKHPRPDLIVEEALRSRFSPGEIQALYDEVTYIPPEKIPGLLRLFETLVLFVMAEDMVEVRSNEGIDDLLNQLYAHPENNLTIEEAASIACLSASALNKQFNKLFGKSFKQVQLEIKMDRAENLLRTFGNISVNEVANQLGYRDPYYFSRIFKKYRGYPPSAVQEFR